MVCTVSVRNLSAGLTYARQPSRHQQRIRLPGRRAADVHHRHQRGVDALQCTLCPGQWLHHGRTHGPAAQHDPPPGHAARGLQGHVVHHRPRAQLDGFCEEPAQEWRLLLDAGPRHPHHAPGQTGGVHVGAHQAHARAGSGGRGLVCARQAGARVRAPDHPHPCRWRAQHQHVGQQPAQALPRGPHAAPGGHAAAAHAGVAGARLDGLERWHGRGLANPRLVGGGGPGAGALPREHDPAHPQPAPPAQRHGRWRPHAPRARAAHDPCAGQGHGARAAVATQHPGRGGRCDGGDGKVQCGVGRDGAERAGFVRPCRIPGQQPGRICRGHGATLCHGGKLQRGRPEGGA